jgi:hypothetical protein
VFEDSPSDNADSPETDASFPVTPRRQYSSRTCLCGHPRNAQQHYRRGSDCALCGCARYTDPFRAWITRQKG